MINQKNTAIFIPARLAATRLPNKPLELINNQPMIIHVWKRAVEASLGKVVVATDSDEIDKIVNNYCDTEIYSDFVSFMKKNKIYRNNNLQNLINKTYSPRVKY